ncbi:MAG: ABC transporter permease [Candidatus Thermoplasmatota archaeon]|nr:ABC transporter permease [Candidatus Thermoplasmatota archaeon]
MNAFVAIRKLIQGVVLLVLVTIIIFVIFRLMPGNPADLILLSLKSKPTLAEKQQLLKSFGLENGKWSYQAFTTFIYDMFTAHWGMDYYYGATVSQIIFTALPYTLVLVGGAAVLGWIFGIPLGITTTRLRGKKSETAILTSSLIVSSIPYLVLAVLLYLYLIAYLHWFPVSGYFSFSDLEHPTFFSVLTVFRTIAIPLVSLFLIGAAGHLITMRATMVSILGEDFITTARAKGVREKDILRKHAARNALIPVSTRMALEFALILSGALIVDIIFSYPGIGYYLYEATLKEDYPLIEAATFMISVITIFAYLIIDYVHAWLDPRIRV